MAPADDPPKRDIGAAWARHKRQVNPKHPEPEPERDILAEHFGPDWRTSFDFRSSPTDDEAETAGDDGAAGDAPTEVEPADPYEVLGVEQGASWEQIVEAHRALARENHPDQLHDASDEQRAEAEERIRDINVAYRELRVRRGK